SSGVGRCWYRLAQLRGPWLIRSCSSICWLNHSGQMLSPMLRPSGSSGRSAKAGRERTYHSSPVACRDPARTEIVVLRQDAARQVIEMPTGLDQHDAAARLHAGADVRAEPFPIPLPVDVALGLLVALDRVVDDEQIGAFASDRAADTRGDVFGAVLQLPAINGGPIGGHSDAEG